VGKTRGRKEPFQPFYLPLCGLFACNLMRALAISSLFPVCVTAHERLTLASPQSVGLPATTEEALDETLKGAVESGATAGAEAVVLFGHRIVYHNAFGDAMKLPKEIPLRNDSIYDLASLTKVIVTTASLMILGDRGQLDLDKPVKTYIPEFDGNGRESVTVRRLLTHTSGLGNLNKVHLDHSGKDAYLEEICKTDLQQNPGEHRIYSDVGMMLAGFVAERISGQPLDRFAKKNIFEPLGMDSTFFRPRIAKRWRCAATELCPWRGRVMQGEVHDENAFAMGGVAGHAGLFSTARDLAVFARMLLNGGIYDGKRILKESTVREMLTAQPIPDYRFQALGWRIQEERGQDSGWLLSPKTYGHTGFTGTSLWIDPDNETVAILLANAVHPSRYLARKEELRKGFHEVLCRLLEGLPGK